MYPNQGFFESLQVVAGFAPIALTTARSGDWVSLKDYRRCAMLFFGGIGTAGDDPTITLREAKNVAGDDPLNLVFKTVYSKQAAVSLDAVATFTKISRDTPIATYTHTDGAEQVKMWGLEVRAEELSDGYDCVQLNVSDVGTNAQLGCVLYFMLDPRYLPNGIPAGAIAD